MNDQQIRNWINEAGTENLSKDFHLKVLSRIEETHPIQYKPVISSLGIKLIASFILFIVLFTILFIPNDNSTATLWNQIPEFGGLFNIKSLPHISLPKIQLGPVFSTSILSFTLLFLAWILYQSKRLKLG